MICGAMKISTTLNRDKRMLDIFATLFQVYMPDDDHAELSHARHRSELPRAGAIPKYPVLYTLRAVVNNEILSLTMSMPTTAPTRSPWIS